MRRAVLTILAVLVAVGGPLLALTLDGRADDAGGDRIALAWQGEPIEVQPDPGLEGDRIIQGRLRNTGLRSAELDVERVRVVDDEGRPVRFAVRFIHHFVHGIYSPDMIRREGPPPESERRRLGELAIVRPGESVPITVSWRGADAAALELGGTRVPLR